MLAISKTPDDLRATFRPKVPGGRVLIRPDAGFHEVTEEEIREVVDDVERLFLLKGVGEVPSKLEQFALRVLSESHF